MELEKVTVFGAVRDKDGEQIVPPVVMYINKEDLNKDMGYIDKELGIKSSANLEKYLRKELNRDIVVSKLSSNLKVTWAIDSKLHSVNIGGSVMYIIRVEQIDEVIDTIKNSLKNL